MSTRQMAHQYMAPNYSNSMGGGSFLDSIMQLISPIKGGPTFDASGNVTFSPYTGHGAGALNQQAALPIYLQNKQGEQQIKLEGMRNENAKALQQLVSSGAIDLEKLRGTNAMDLAKFNASSQIDLEGVKTENKIKEDTNRGVETRRTLSTSGEEDRKSTALKQQAKVLENRGIPFSESNLGAYNQTIVDPTLRSYLNDLMLQIRAQEDPATQKAATTGFQQNLLAPAYKNMREGTLNLPANTVGLVPNVGITQDYLTATGPLATEKTQLMGETRIPEGQAGAGTIMNPGKPVTTTTYSGGGIKPNILDLIKQAQNLPTGTNNPVNPSISQPIINNSPANTMFDRNPYSDINNTNNVYQMMKLLGY